MSNVIIDELESFKQKHRAKALLKGDQEYWKFMETDSLLEARSILMRPRPVAPRKRGRRSVYSDEQILKVRELLKGGMQQRKISKEVGVGISTVSKINNSSHWSFRNEQA